MKPVEADARTRTQHVPLDAPTAAAAEPTVAMRSDANRKIERKSKEPENGDVLTVMTLVSRVSGKRNGSTADKREPGPLTKAEALALEFQAQQSTVTVPKEKLGDDFRSAVERAGSGETIALVDETPHTQDRSRSPVRSRSMSRRQTQQRSRILALFAASVAGVALITIVVLLTSKPAKDDDAASSKKPKDEVHVQVTSAAPAATVMLPSGDTMSLPATIGALPGDSLEIVVKAPGYQEKSARVSIPIRGAHDVPLDVQLVPLPATLKIAVKPENATVTVAGDDNIEHAYTPGMLVDGDKPLTISASAPGFASLKRAIAVHPGDAIEQSIELERVDDPASAPVTTTTKKPVEKHASASSGAPAKLKVMANLWGQVTIDGKTYDDSTPLTVELKPGRHTVTVAHPPQKKTFSITLKPGEFASQKVTFDGT